MFYRRYVDDIFVLFKSAEHLSKFHAYLNTCHPNMAFPFEQAVNGIWQTTVYKVGMIYTLAYQSFKTCSDWTKFHEELNFLKHVSLKNGYPL